jgi:hypothetical protein
MASLIWVMRFSAARTKAREEIGLPGFQMRGIWPFKAEVPVPARLEKRFGMKAATKFSTRFAASAATAVEREDSVPASKIPLVMAPVYTIPALQDKRAKFGPVRRRCGFRWARPLMAGFHQEDFFYSPWSGKPGFRRFQTPGSGAGNASKRGGGKSLSVYPELSISLLTPSPKPRILNVKQAKDDIHETQRFFCILRRYICLAFPIYQP